MNNKDIFFKHLAPTSHQPVLIEVESAKGVIIKDTSGKEYYDLIAGIGVATVGHNNEQLNKAIIAQLEKHAHVMVYGEYIQSAVNNLAVKLSQLLPDQLSNSYFVNSGTEANEGAVKLAKRITDRHKIIAFKKGYHGNTQGSMSVSSNDSKKRPYRPLIPGVKFISFNNLDDLMFIDEDVAGVIIPNPGFLSALRERCTQVGTQLIFDEVQTGIGRTGKMFAFEHFGVVPDIITLAKGLGGGMPIGAFISSYDNMQLLAKNPMLGHITTFGGNPVACASAKTVLDIVSEPALMSNIEVKGQLFDQQLAHPEVKSIRRIGLMLAIELENEEKVNKAIKLALEEGVIIYWFLSTRNAFRISPPLTITKEEIRRSCEILIKVFNKIQLPD